MAMPGRGDGEPSGGPFEEQLSLADGEERLPWLESDDEPDQPQVDTGRVVAFAAVGLLALIVLVGALYWFLREPGSGRQVADGSVIEAPDTPYKTRPDNPGGSQVAGTGETSFEVAEGEKVEGRIAGSGAVPRPSIDREQAGTDGDQPSAPSGGVGVQVGAYAAREAAEAGWSTLTARLESLQGRSHRIVQGTADSGIIYRLQAVAGSVAEAEALCRSIRAEGGDCQVKR